MGEETGSHSAASVSDSVRSRTLVGIRWVLALNLLAVPISFVTNMILGRVSPLALGSYSAIQILVGTFLTFVVLGGPQVFTRFVPALDRDRRFSFLVSYTGVILVPFLTAYAALALFFPGALSVVLGKFGEISPVVAFALLATVVVWSYTSWFLFSALHGPRAIVTQKLVILGYLVAVVLGAGPFRARLNESPSEYLALSSIAIYLLASLAGMAFVSRTDEYRASSGFRWLLPRGFWPVLFYTHSITMVGFMYRSLAPAIVLLWLDRTALGYLHAAIRIGTLVALVPGMSTLVIAPGLSNLEVSGRRDEAFGQARTGIRATLLLMVPVAVVLCLFAEDAMAVIGPEFPAHRDLLSIVAVSALAAPVVQLAGGIAAAIGAFRTFLLASLVFVITALALILTLVPWIGLPGAAIAMTLSSFVQQVALMVLLRRRFQVRMPRGTFTAWLCGVAAAAVAIGLRPGRVASAVVAIVILLVFVLVAGVKPAEVKHLGHSLFRRR